MARQIVVLLLVLVCLAVGPDANADKHRIYIGTYTRGSSISEGIYTATFDDASGKLSEPHLAASADNPSFLAVHPNGKWVYAVNETNDFGGEPTGAVSAFRVTGESGELKFVNQQPSGGGAPCHCNIDNTGKYLLVANYLGGNVAVFPIQDDGALGPHTCLINHVGSSINAQRQEAPHAHSINLSADNRFAYAADLGTDRIMIYRFDGQNGLLVPAAPNSVQTPAGGGPRHFSLHPSGKTAYSNNELTAFVTVYDRNPRTGGLKAAQSLSTLPAGASVRKSTAECLVHPSGRFVYVSNRGHDSIAIYSVEKEAGRLNAVAVTHTEGREPRNFFITPDGKWLFAENQNSDSVVVFRVSQKNGMITATDSRITVGKPVCIRIGVRQ